MVSHLVLEKMFLFDSFITEVARAGAQGSPAGKDNVTILQLK